MTANEVLALLATAREEHEAEEDLFFDWFKY